MRALAAALAILILHPAAAAPNGIGLDVDIAAPDGFVLKATYWAADAPGPGVLLLHQCNRDRTAWAGAARALAGAGFHVLTMDFRGFGGSVGPGVRSFRQQSDELWPLWEGDVDRAVAFLTSLPAVGDRPIGVMGASCGGSQALLLAARTPRVGAVVFLSSGLPWVDDQDVQAFQRNHPVPVLAVAAEGDEGTARRTQELFAGSRHENSRLILYKGDEHGVPLFDRDPHLVETIVAFFAANL
jgi:dienelactone hydrolase